MVQPPGRVGVVAEADAVAGVALISVLPWQAVRPVHTKSAAIAAATRLACGRGIVSVVTGGSLCMTSHPLLLLQAEWGQVPITPAAHREGRYHSLPLQVAPGLGIVPPMR